MGTMPSRRTVSSWSAFRLEERPNEARHERFPQRRFATWVFQVLEGRARAKAVQTHSLVVERLAEFCVVGEDSQLALEVTVGRALPKVGGPNKCEAGQGFVNVVSPVVSVGPKVAVRMTVVCVRTLPLTGKEKFTSRTLTHQSPLA